MQNDELTVQKQGMAGYWHSGYEGHAGMRMPSWLNGNFHDRSSLASYLPYSSFVDQEKKNKKQKINPYLYSKCGSSKLWVDKILDETGLY